MSFALQSSLVSDAMSHSSGTPFPLQSSSSHSSPIPLELQDKVRRIVDKAAHLSRAGFDRGAREILMEFGEMWAETDRRHAPASAQKPP